MNSLPLRFWANVSFGECWVWTAGCNNGGYGQFRVLGKKQQAHRLSYEAFAGPIPPGLFIDHLCRVRACVRPDHMEPVTSRENTLRSPIALAALEARKQVCPQGHPYSAENTRFNGRRRLCRICQREHDRARNPRNRRRIAV